MKVDTIIASNKSDKDTTIPTRIIAKLKEFYTPTWAKFFALLLALVALFYTVGGHFLW